MFSVLCKPDILFSLNRDDLGSILQSIFPNSIRDLEWYAKFGEMIVKGFSGVNRYIDNDERAMIYYNHLYQTIVPELQSEYKRDGKAYFVERLIDVYKILSCLLRYAFDESPSFSIEVDKEALEDFENRIIKYQEENKNIYTFQERTYTKLITWIITELIIEQDGITGEGSDED